MTINLAGGPKEYAEFRIGDRKAELYFNDELNLKIANTRLSVGKRLDELDDQKKMKALDKKSVSDQRDYLDGLYKGLREELTGFFDEQFGEGAGAELYKLTNKSTERMSAAFFMVVKEYDELRAARDRYISDLYKPKSRKTKKK
ncbi:hypothetical protein [Lactobacillus sp. CBA3605]|uniref:hypothetical protein n=1 Tax=Lactobacillus sp. CBA3605 TaxID=2099788 RepID=UPI001F33D552|nr:hypothetical protein [Lactobacillus sp. CBA3605]